MDEATLHTMQEGLERGQKETTKVMLTASNTMDRKTYWVCNFFIRRTLDKVRARKKKRLKNKESNLNRKSTKCKQHTICNWMRKHGK